MKMLRRIAGLLGLLMIFGDVCVAESMVEVPFSFMGVKWSAAPDEIGKILGAEAVQQEVYDPSVDMTTTILAFSGIDCLGYEVPELRFVYIDDALVMIACNFDEDSVSGNTDGLLGALTALYGEPTEVYDDKNIALADMFSSTRTRAVWNPDENTSIALAVPNPNSAFEEEESPYFCSITISNPPRLEAIQEAMMEALNAETPN